MFHARSSFLAQPGDIVWITGGSAGLGRALALRLAEAGYTVAITARRVEALNAVALQGGARILVYPGDITDAAAMDGLVVRIENEHGPIGLAILNAGVYHLAERRRFDAALFWTTVETNLGGTARCLDPLLTAMLPRRRGQIAIVASLAGYGGIPGSIAYGAAKAAMINMAEGLRLTYAPAGLKIQIVSPGFIDTAMTAANDYPMPFMMDAEAAAGRIMKGLRRQNFEIAFPKRLAWPAKAARLLPYAAWLKLMARATRRALR